MAENDQKTLQAEINRRVRMRLPPHGWDTTVAIVIANRPSVHLLGTGSLFEIGKYRFVVTAAHVVQIAHTHEKTIAISDGDRSFVSLHGNWMISAPSQRDGIEDPFDVAIYTLPSEAMLRLRGKCFLRREDIDFCVQPNTAVFGLFGFPGIWANPSHTDGEPVSVKALEYTTCTYQGTTESLLGYHSKYPSSA